MARVKICGINSEAAFDAAHDSGADWIGFVFFARSPRFVTPARALQLSARKPGGPLRVGLFVQPGDAEIAATLAVLPLDVLQIYADAPRAAAIRARFGVTVWRAVGVGVAADLPRDAAGFDGHIIEAKPPADAIRPGGNAVTFDWTLTAGWDAQSPWLLAGGLTPGNVADAIRQSGARAVDVSSGVESGPGVKDASLIAQFIAAANARALP